MKLGKFLILIVILSACASINNPPKEEALDTLVLKNKYQLNYNLAYGDERYQFIIHILKMQPDRVFHYAMTNMRRTNATVVLRESALDTAKRSVNTFTGRDDTLDHNALTVWLSREVFADIVNTDSCWLDDGSSVWTTKYKRFYNAGKALYNYELNGVPQTIEIVKVKELNGSSEFWILNDLENPLIIRMDVGWVIWLKEINYS